MDKQESNLSFYLNEKKTIQDKLMKFIDNQCNEEENYNNLICLFQDQHVLKSKSEIKIFLYMLNQVSNHHHRSLHFFDKIEKIFQYFKHEVQKKFSNYEIFSIFKQNKRFLLFLFEEKVLKFDEDIFSEMIKIQTYFSYFSPEINQYINENGIDKEKYSYKPGPFSREKLTPFSDLRIIEETEISDFKEKRLIGENDNLICEYIRKDLIEEFIIYIKKNDCSVNKKIPQSDFETNPLLLDRNNSKQSNSRLAPKSDDYEMTLIEYAAFFGSNQIFKYLFKNGANLTASLWIYAIHGEDQEIINTLIENDLKLTEEEEKEEEEENDDDNESEYEGTDCEDFFTEGEIQMKFDIELKKNITYQRCLVECIKCHSDDVLRYIEQNFTSENSKDMTSYGFRFYNFLYINCDNVTNYFFYYACKYDYLTIVIFLLSLHKIDINEKFI